MPSMEDYYRQKAAENTGHKPMRDAIPNGSDVRQRTYGGHMASDDRDSLKALARMPREFVIRQALKVECRDCMAAVGDRCLSFAKGKEGTVLENVHSKRSHDGMKLVRK
jgi:hypothetical protein